MPSADLGSLIVLTIAQLLPSNFCHETPPIGTKAENAMTAATATTTNLTVAATQNFTMLLPFHRTSATTLKNIEMK